MYRDNQLTKDKFDYVAGRAFLQRKQEALQAKRLKLWQQAQADAQQIIDMIAGKYVPKKIIQWGSVLEPRHFSEASDIDLAVAGVDSILFLQLLGEAEDMTKFPLDLIRWEDIDPSFQKIISMKGKIVYAKN